MKRNSRSSRRAVALVVVLSIILLAAVLVVGLATAMRMEREASFYHLERARADFLARQGVDLGRALLRAATATNRFWISQPGAVWATASNTFIGPMQRIDLSSGFTPNTASNTSVDLNRRGLTGADRLLNPGGTNFNFQWIYVQKDGSLQTNVPPTISTNLAGRFAFWVDDESSRLDLSTAHQRTTNAINWAQPSEIDLGVLPGITAAQVTTIFDRSSVESFQTPYEAMSLGNAVFQSVLMTNRFSLTHYTQDPEMNPWGEPRIVLSTYSARAANRSVFLKVSDQQVADPGLLSNLNASDVNASLASIMKSLNRAEWPYVAQNASFEVKYGQKGAWQLALDILEYVRAAESAEEFVQPLTVEPSGTNIVLKTGLSTDTMPANILIGTTRRPQISEMALWVNAQTNATGDYDGKLYVELYLPPGYGVPTTNFSKVKYIAFQTNAPAAITNISTTGNFARIEQDISLPAQSGSRPTNASMRVAVFRDSTNNMANLLDVAPLAAADGVSYAVDATNVATNLVHSLEVSDPRVNKSSTNWVSVATNSLFTGFTNSIWTNAVSSQPPQDTTAAGVVTQVSAQLPFHASNGKVGSVGELGFVTTGVAAGVPWRSVRLQPGSATSTNTVPDWALLDLFAAPVDSPYAPSRDVTAGRVNVNTLVVTNAWRTNGLSGLFTNTAVTNLAYTVTNAVTVTNLAPGGLSYGYSTAITNLPAVGQLAEIRGVADQGEQSEAVMRQISSLGTVRGNVFSIYAFGQALKVNPVTSKMTTTGEKMVRAIVERYFDEAGMVQYRVIYWGEIYP